MAVRLVPPVETLTVAHLRGHTAITPLVGTRVGTELYAGTTPAVWLSHVTGSESVRNHLVSQMVDLRSYGRTKTEAELLARTVHAVMHELPGVHPLGVVSAVTNLTMPAWSPDEGFTPPRPRYVGSYLIVLHPLP